MDSYEPQQSALVAVFSNRDAASRAIEQLHDEGFHRTWLGVTEPMSGGAADGTSSRQTASTTRVENDNALARFFGAGDETLHDALLRHGVSETDAAQLDDTLAARSAVVTVDGANHPELAAQIVAKCGGEMVTSKGARSLYDTYGGESSGTLPAERRNDLGDFHRGERVDEARRITLREERVSVDKQRERAGEASVGTRVVTDQVDLDVPIMHEELYIERRPAAAAGGNVGEIGDGQRISVPLERERAAVTKSTVATEDVSVGKRRVDETQHVSETVRKEELDVNDDAASELDTRSDSRPTPR